MVSAICLRLIFVLKRTMSGNFLNHPRTSALILSCAECWDPKVHAKHWTLSHGHTQSRATSGDIFSSPHTRVTLQGHARVCCFCWGHLCENLPCSVTSAHLPSVPACWRIFYGTLWDSSRRGNSSSRQHTLLRLFSGRSYPTFNQHRYWEMLKCHGLLWRTRSPPGNSSLLTAVQVNTEQCFTPDCCP